MLSVLPKILSHLSIFKIEKILSPSQVVFSRAEAVLVALLKDPGRCGIIVSLLRCYGNLQLLHPWWQDDRTPEAPGWFGSVLSTLHRVSSKCLQSRGDGLPRAASAVPPSS